MDFLTHYFFFVLVAILVRPGRPRPATFPLFFRRWTTVALLAMIPLGIWLAWFFSPGSPSLGIGWIRPPIVGDVPLTVWNLASGYGGVLDAPSALLGLSVLALVGFGLAGSTHGDGARLLLVGILLPILAVWVISQRRPVYVDRYFVVLLPFVAALAAIGASTIARWAAQSRRPVVLLAVSATAFALVGLSAAWTVHSAPKFMKEDWRGLAAFLQTREASAEEWSLSEPEITLPLSYYGQQERIEDDLALIPSCGDLCWWVLRQPYTATHAFTQSVQEPGRSQLPNPPAECEKLESWESPTGVSAWELSCPTTP